MRQTEHTT